MNKNNKQDARQIRRYRIRNKISGTSQRPRLSIYKSNTNIYVQLIDDSTSSTLLSSSTKILKINKSNIESAIKLGNEIADLMKKKKITEIVFDRSGYIYHGKIKALAEEIRKKGIKF